MNPSNFINDRYRCKPSRCQKRHHGISLIEVIACMAIVGIMMVPITSVMRSSRQAITFAEGSTPETDLRDGSRWLGHLIQDNTLIATQSDGVVLQMTTGDLVKIYVDNDELVMNNGNEAVVLMSDVVSAEFAEIKQSTHPGELIGVRMKIDTLDPTSGEKNSLTSVASIPTQY